MKFLLVIMICSSTAQVCTPPKETNVYSTWFECASNGYMEAYRLNQIMGKNVVNKEKTIINFQCRVVNNI
jgi:hypothetical protein